MRFSHSLLLFFIQNYLYLYNLNYIPLMTWKETLLRHGRLNSMCTENISALKECENKSEAIQLYKKTIDWALERNFPSIEILRSEFSDCQNDGLFVDHTFNGETLNDHQTYIFHNCKGIIKVGLCLEKAIIPMLYFANNCNMTIVGTNTLRVRPDIIPCYVFGENSICAENDINAIFRIHREEVKDGF